MHEEYTPLHQGIKLLPYNEQDGLPVGHVEKKQKLIFFGRYGDQTVWKFFLMWSISGTILHTFSVSSLGVVVDIKRNRVN